MWIPKQCRVVQPGQARNRAIVSFQMVGWSWYWFVGQNYLLVKPTAMPYCTPSVGHSWRQHTGHPSIQGLDRCAGTTSPREGALAATNVASPTEHGTHAAPKSRGSEIGGVGGVEREESGNWIESSVLRPGIP